MNSDLTSLNAVPGYPDETGTLPITPIGYIVDNSFYFASLSSVYFYDGSTISKVTSAAAFTQEFSNQFVFERFYSINSDQSTITLVNGYYGEGTPYEAAIWTLDTTTKDWTNVLNLTGNFYGQFRFSDTFIGTINETETDKIFSVYELASGTLVTEVSGAYGETSNYYVTNSGIIRVLVTFNKSPEIYNLSGTKIGELEIPTNVTNWVTDLSGSFIPDSYGYIFSNNKNYIAGIFVLIIPDTEIVQYQPIVWDATTGNVISNDFYIDATNSIKGVSDDGTKLLIAENNSNVILFDTQTGSITQPGSYLNTTQPIVLGNNNLNQFFTAFRNVDDVYNYSVTSTYIGFRPFYYYLRYRLLGYF